MISRKKKCLYILPVNAITVPIGNNSSTLISTFGLIKSQNWNSIGHVIGGNSLTKDLLALIFQGWRCNNNSFIRKPNYIEGGQKNLNSDFTKFFVIIFFFREITQFLTYTRSRGIIHVIGANGKISLQNCITKCDPPRSHKFI